MYTFIAEYLCIIVLKFAVLYVHKKIEHFNFRSIDCNFKT